MGRMSKRNGPQARATPIEHSRLTGTAKRSAPAVRYGRAEQAKVLALQDEAARADADYQRLRTAYLDIVQNDPDNEVGQAMIGADMNRAHVRLQALTGLPRMPFGHDPAAAMRRETHRLVGDKH